MVDGHQLDLVHVEDLPELFGELQDEFTVLLAQRRRRDLHVLAGCRGRGVGPIATHDPQGHAQRASPHHVCHEREATPVPGVDERARPLQYLPLHEGLVAARLELRLGNTVRPHDSNGVRDRP